MTTSGDTTFGTAPTVGKGPSFPTPSSVATVAPVAPFAEADARRIGSALSSQDPETAAAVLIPEIREAFRQSGTPVVPPGSMVTVLTDRFEAIRPDYASVPLVVTGARSGQFVAVLVYEDGQWLVATTQEVS